MTSTVAKSTAALWEGLAALRPQPVQLAQAVLGDIASAEDAVHDVLLATAHRGHLPSRPYLRVCVRNAALKELLRRHRFCSAEEVLVSAGGSVLMPNRDVVIDLERAIRRLSPSEFRAIRLVCVEGYRANEAAKLVGVSARTIENQVHRARLKIRGAYAKSAESE